MDDNRKGALLIILAGTCWGVISIFINHLSAAGLGEMQISFLRQFFAVLVFALIILIRDRSKFRIPLTVTMYTLLFSFIFLIPFSGLSSLTGMCRANPMILIVAFLMCLVTAVLAQYFFSVGLRLIESGKAAIYGAIAGFSDPLLFVFSSLAIIPLAGVMGKATDDIACFAGQKIGAAFFFV